MSDEASAVHFVDGWSGSDVMAASRLLVAVNVLSFWSKLLV
jgi:hypothetical protein